MSIHIRSIIRSKTLGRNRSRAAGAESVFSIDTNALSVGLVGALVAGVVGIGIGARIAMRAVGLIAGLEVEFSIAGTLFILVFGAILGILWGLPYLPVRRFLSSPSLWKGASYGAILVLGFLVPLFFLMQPEGELDLVAPLVGLAIFAPVPIVYGLILEATMQRLEKGSEEESDRKVGLASTALLVLALALVSIGMSSLMDASAPLPRVIARNYRHIGLDYDSARQLRGALTFGYLLVYCGLAGVIFWRGARTRMARFTALTLLLMGGALFNTGKTFAGMTVMDATGAVRLLSDLFRGLGLVGIIVLMYTFPDGRPVPRWTRRWTRPLAVLAGLMAFAWLVNPLQTTPVHPSRWPALTAYVLVVGALASGVAAQVKRFRSEPDPAKRRALLWPLLGFSGAVAGFALTWASALIVPGLRPHDVALPFSLFAFAPYLLTWLLIPSAIVFAMHRHGLWNE